MDSVDSPIVDSPIVDSPIVDSPIVDSPIVDSPIDYTASRNKTAPRVNVPNGAC